MIQEPSNKSASRRGSWTDSIRQNSPSKTSVIIFGYGGHCDLGYISSDGEVGTGAEWLQ